MFEKGTGNNQCDHDELDNSQGPYIVEVIQNTIVYLQFPWQV